MAKVKPKLRTCNFCHFDMSMWRLACPHCGRPSLFPNVELAQEPVERDKLKARYDQARYESDTNGTRAIVDEFEQTCAGTQAVMAVFVIKLHREMSSGTDLFETYYQLETLRNRVDGESELDWQKLRPQAETELLGDDQNNDKLHYACLSMNGHFLRNYGDCAITLSESMTAHRCSCFEGNTAVEYHRRHSFDDLLRCDWQNRQQLCVAMFAGGLTSTSSSAQFETIILQSSPVTGLDDIFVEVHVFGTLTARSFESVLFDRSRHGRDEATYVDSVTDKLNRCNVQVL